MIYTFIFFILGTVFGSFINMAIYRVRHNLNFFGYSFCDYCKKPLRLLNLFPISSYIISKGLSSCCKKKLDYTNPIVELITGLSFFIIFYNFITTNPLPNIYDFFVLIIYLVLSLIIIFTFFYDLKYFEIPLVPILVGYGLYVLLNITNVINYKNTLINNLQQDTLGTYLLKTNYVADYVNFFIKENILYSFYFALFVFVFLLALHILTKGKGMGFGDVYTAPLFALLLSFPSSIVYLFSSFIFGSIYGVGSILVSNNNLKSRIPFGPFLILGFIFALFFGNELVKYYLKFL